MKSSEYLIAAKAVIADPANHLQSGVFAEDEYGEELLGHDPRACKFCSVGALMKVGGYVFSEAYTYLQRSANAMGGRSAVTIYNDTHDHADVMRLFDLAIERATTAGD